MKKAPIARAFLLLGLVLLALSSARADDPARKYTFVIVHGATAGGWEWKRTGKFLADDGHEVHRVTLTGLGERMHLATAGVNLETHINDVVNLILFEDLHDVVLSGHSYGGMVITGVMDRIPERIRHVIFLDAMVPDDGQSAFDLVGGPPPKAKIVDGLVHFPWYNPDAPFPRGVPHPVKTFSEPVSYKNPAVKSLPVTYVAFVPAEKAEARATTDKNWHRAMTRGWTIRTFPGGHVAQQENPRGVATLMEDAVNDKNQPATQASAPPPPSK
ncbi:alpha/beta hydrolase [Nibricoccus aquaticus]|uniref:Alpha/beta hydrolase n=1 Tax=Nibricoccus aquaticus TaxID=2576891 RepID=A0A290QH28_9BACT|nr:alpha/beta hydrolase family protein [Nibricoccus aquaticus]ATC65586.1 alpha/beta hydrolase [Nibricoccus aquaticus]